ncbi:MAG: DUF1353 domain-containing protein [Candidatus Scalindua sp.]
MPNTDPKLRRPWFDISFIILTFIGIGVILSVYVYYPKLILQVSIVGIALYLGFGIPRWQGGKIRKERARNAKIDESDKWGFHSRDREGPWLNYIDYPLVKRTDYANNKYFYSEWLMIHDGFIIVNPGKPDVKLKEKTVDYDFAVKRAYAWDGCTPKRWFFWFSLIGTPDWGQKIENVKTIKKAKDDKYVIKEKQTPPFWQRAHHASLIHDVLYQYLDTIPISKRNVDRLFYKMLKESDVSWFIARLYHFGVRYFGAFEIGENAPKENSELKFLNSQGLNLKT